MEFADNNELGTIENEMNALKCIPSKIIEGGQRMVQAGFKISIRDVCEHNEIHEGDIITIYIKKTNIKSKKRD